MNNRSPFRFTLLTVAAGVVAGAIVIAQQPQVQRVQVPRVGVPSIPAPVPGSPRRPPTPEERVPQITMPVMGPELVAAWVQAVREKLPYLPGRVLVKFRTGSRNAARVLAAVQTDPQPDSLEWIGDVAIVKDRSGEDPRQLAERFTRDPEVEFAEPDYISKRHSEPNDPSYDARQWNFQTLNIPRAWDIQPGGSSNIIVAIVDTGVTAINATNVAVKTWNGFAIIDHIAAVAPSPDFTLSRFVQPRDFTVTPATPGTTVIDTDDHGTHVAGTVGEDTNNGIALAGIAYNVRIMPLKACVSLWDVQFAWSAAGNTGFVPSDSDGCASSATSAAIRFAADNGAKVLNYSIGSTSPNQSTLNAMNYAISRGTFIAMSNGNEFGDGNPTTYPAAYAPQLQGAMSVAATNRTDNRASYSSTGSYTEISAPGGDSSGFIYQVSLRLSDHAPPSQLFAPRFDRYDERGIAGTSMASPHVAGLAALLASHGITDIALIEGIIKSSAKDLGDPGRDNSFGHGRIQPFVALFGQGIVR